jgi:membrane protein
VSTIGSPRLMERVDRVQQSRAWLAFPVAVGHRYAIQRCATFAAMVAYYGFISILPLFLVATSLTKVFLAGYPGLQTSVTNSLLEHFGVLGSELERTIQPSTGDAFAIVIGLIVALWAGLGVMQSLQVAFSTIWGIPREEQPTFARARLRSLVIIIAFGIVLLASAVLTSLVSLLGLSVGGQVMGFVASYLFAFAVYVLVYRVLTGVDLAFRDVLPGAALAAGALVALQTVGALIIGRWIGNASALYGYLGVTLGMLLWISLLAQVTLLGAELNAVWKRRLWPRSILDRSDGAASAMTQKSRT